MFDYQAMLNSLSHPVAVFTLQLIVIIVMSQVCGYYFKKIGQPAVLGEIVAGIALGPSLIGGLFPGFSRFVFPESSLGNLQLVSEIGLILFMFVIGLELDLRLVRKKAKSALIISNVSIIVPYGLGILLALYLHDDYAPGNIPFFDFALFIGIAMSITAFPVLARILRERGISNTRMGSIALVSAATNDVAGWCMLAGVIAIAKAGSLGSSMLIIVAATAYSAVMFYMVRPLLGRMWSRQPGEGKIKHAFIAVIFITVLASAYCAEVIGIHSLFGAFMAGVVMPSDVGFRRAIIDKIEDVALVMFLPVFFIFTGLRTHIELLNSLSLWFVCLCIIVVAVVGKFGGSAIAARLCGESLHDSLAIGALMNTRGLMELIILNIGYDLGILSPQIFTMMVVMALVTTFMTSPILNILDRYYGRVSGSLQ